MPTLDLGLGQEPDDEPISFDVWPDTFVCRLDVPAAVFRDIAEKIAGAGQPGQLSGALSELTMLDNFLEAVLEPDSYALFAYRMGADPEELPDNPIGLRTAIAVLRGLIQAFTAVPTTEPSPSSAGPPPAGGFSMDGAPAAGSNPLGLPPTAAPPSSTTSSPASSARKRASSTTGRAKRPTGSTAKKPAKAAGKRTTASGKPRPR
jgi:hypothetical protein